MKTIHATKDLVLELWPAGHVSEHPAVVITNKAVYEDDNTYQVVIVHLHEIRHLIDALTKAAVDLVDNQ